MRVLYLIAIMLISIVSMSQIVVYTLNDTVLSNIVYWYNMNGREHKQLINGINVILYNSGRFIKIYK